MSEPYSEAEAREIIRQSVLIEEAYRQGRSDEKYSLAYAPPVFEKALGEATVTPTDEREGHVMSMSENDLREMIKDAIGYELVPVSIPHHPEIRNTFRTMKDRDLLVTRISAALLPLINLPAPASSRSAVADAIEAHFQPTADNRLNDEGEWACAECGWAFGWWRPSDHGPEGMRRRAEHLADVALRAANEVGNR